MDTKMFIDAIMRQTIVLIAYCPNNRGERLRGLAVIVVQQTAETWPTLDGAGGPVVVARRGRWPDELTTQLLVEALSEIVGDKFAEQMSKMAFAEDHEVVEPEPKGSAC